MDMKWRLAVGVCAAAAAVGAVLALTHHQDVATKRGHAVMQLRDPDSVQFRNERLTEGGWLCGEMNGKNAYGAYTGFKRFISDAPDDVYIEGSGYAGVKGGQPTRQILADLDVSIEVSRGLLAAAKANPSLPVPTPAEIEASGKRAIFEKQWASRCA